MLAADNTYIQPAVQGRAAGSTVAANISLRIRWDGTAAFDSASDDLLTFFVIGDHQEYRRSARLVIF